MAKRMRIWCPGCGCDVGHLLSQQTSDAYKKLKADQKDIQKAVRWLRSAVKAMEAVAQATPEDELRSTREIFRQWSTAILAEVNKQFPDKSVG